MDLVARQTDCRGGRARSLLLLGHRIPSFSPMQSRPVSLYSWYEVDGG